jgi:hypothetical protein
MNKPVEKPFSDLRVPIWGLEGDPLPPEGASGQYLARKAGMRTDVRSLMSHGAVIEALIDLDFFTSREGWRPLEGFGEGWSDAVGTLVTRVALEKAQRSSGSANEITRLSKEVKDLKSRVEQLEKTISEENTGELLVDSNLTWCIDHKELFVSLPHNTFVAINITKGKILVHDVDQSSFARKLAGLTNPDVDNIYVTNVSEFM